MPRKLRFSPPGVPQHIIQRGNNRQACFGRDEDFAAYLHWVQKYSVKFSVSIHAWVLMTNHVHLFCTPASEKGISLMMQFLGRMYVMYFNYTYKRTGMVDDPSEYIWSSYRCNGLSKASALQTAHPLLTDIRDAGLVLGNDRFIKELELLHGHRLRPHSRGRPRVNC